MMPYIGIFFWGCFFYSDFFLTWLFFWGHNLVRKGPFPTKSDCQKPFTRVGQPGENLCMVCDLCWGRQCRLWGCLWHSCNQKIEVRKGYFYFRNLFFGFEKFPKNGVKFWPFWFFLDIKKWPLGVLQALANARSTVRRRGMSTLGLFRHSQPEKMLKSGG